jgi:hypothetical protein
MTLPEMIAYLRGAVTRQGLERIRFALTSSEMDRHRTEQKEALDAIGVLALTAAPLSTFPQDCICCGGVIQSAGVRECHGLGECVEICPLCCGSGVEPKMLAKLVKPHDINRSLDGEARA